MPKSLLRPLFFSVLILNSVAGWSQEMLWGMASSGGEFGAGAIYKTNADGTGMQVMRSFVATAGHSPMNNNLIQAANGKLYGMTNQGGSYLKGVLFELDPTSHTYTVKFNFNGAAMGALPEGGLTQTPDGKIYGLTAYGGTNDKGVIFEFDPTTGIMVKKFDFGGAAGETPHSQMVRTTDGILYGITSHGGSNNVGVLFQFNPSTGIVTKKKDFGASVGSSPLGPLMVSASGKLYGMAFDGGANSLGTIYEYDPTGNTLTKRFDFSGAADGAHPTGGLIQTGSGLLYGMTYSGGSSNNGVLFHFDPAGGTYTKKLDFDGGSYGSAPFGSLLLASDGYMYGTTEQGVSSAGALFQYDPNTNTLLNVLVFSPSTNGPGYFSRSTVIQATNGKLYGTANLGGPGLDGTVFEYDPISTGHDVLVNFGYGTDGKSPIGNLVQALSGKLYGTTHRGGTSGFGTLFEYNITTNQYTKKLDFEGSKGLQPAGGLVLAANGKLYGMTQYGGDTNNGVIFEYDPVADSFVKKWSFSSTETGLPVGSLVQATNGKLYGVSENGGASNLGTLFEYDPATNTFAKKVDFDGSAKGSKPSGTLLLTGGKLYGLANEGGTSGNGVVFEFDPASSTFTKKADFNGTTQGGYPVGSLIKASNNKMYGMASNGGAAFGVLFEYDLVGGLVGRFSFSSLQAVAIQSGLVESTNGKLYGTSTQGGTFSQGILFEYRIGTNTYLKRLDFDGASGAVPNGPLLSVSMQTQTFTFPLGPKTYGDAPFALTATASSGLPVTYTSSTPAVATVAGDILTIHQAGTSVITVSQAGSIHFHPATEGKTLTVNKANQTVTFDPLATKTFGDAPFSVSATASSGLSITTYTSNNTGVATVSGSTITIVGAGTATITASQAGNINYNPGSANQVLTVNKRSQVISFTLPEKVYGDAPFLLTATADSGLPITYSSGDTNIASVSGNTVTILKAGTVVITATQAGNANYHSATLDRNLIIHKSNQTITFTLSTKTYGDAPFTLNGTASSGLPVTYTSGNTAVATVSGNTATLVGAGNSVLTAVQAGNENYNPATLDRTLQVDKSDQTLTFSSLPVKVFGDAPFTVSATASSGLPMSTYTSSNTSVATVSGNTITIVGAGTSQIGAIQNGSMNYNSASAIQTLTVNKSSQSITFGALTAKVYGDSPFTVSATASSGLPVTYSSNNTAVATVSGNTVTIVGAGTAQIEALQSGSSNFLAATALQTLTVNKSGQSIVFDPLGTKVYGDSPFALNATASSGLPVTYTSSNTAVATVSGSTVTIVGAGTTVLTASQAGDGNYNPSSLDRTLLVDKSNQTITFSALPSKVYGDAPFTVSATASSGLPMTLFTSSNTSVATVNGSTITIVSAGTTQIEAFQSGSANFHAASTLQTLTVNKSTQSVTFGPLADKVYGAVPFSVSATASSNLPITFSSSNTGVATVSGNTVTVVGAGTCVLTASQAGDGNYLPASFDQTLQVNKSDQTVTFSALPAKAFGDAPFSISATASSGLPVTTFVSSNTSVATVNGNLITIVGVGSSQIEAIQGGSANFNAASALQTLTVNKGSQLISFGPLTNKVYGDLPFNLNATTTFGLPVTYASSNPAVATVSGNTVTIIGAGSTIITASQPGGATVEPAAPVDQPLTIEKSTQTITFDALPEKRSFDIPFAIQATASSSLPVTFTSSNPAVASVTGNTVTIHAAGVTSITASQSGNTNYLPAVAVNQTLTINVVLGTESQASINKIYPNPAKSSFILEMDARYDEGEQIFLYDQLGRKHILHAEKLEAGKYLCPVSGLPGGLYFVAVPGISKSKPIVIVNH